MSLKMSWSELFGERIFGENNCKGTNVRVKSLRRSDCPKEMSGWGNVRMVMWGSVRMVMQD